eukprot:882114-Amphidinium_carterae.1
MSIFRSGLVLFLHGGRFELQPFVDTKPARWVSERSPFHDSDTWCTKWQYIQTELWTQSHQLPRGGPGIGLGTPAPCRLHLKRYGMRCGPRFLGPPFWRNLQLNSWQPSQPSCAKRQRLVVSQPCYAWDMAFSQKHEAGKTLLCHWRSGKPTVSS